MPAAHFNRYLNFGDWVNPGLRNIEDHVRMRKVPAFFYESDDPNRPVPIVFEPEDFLIAVAGDVLRTNAYAFAPNGNLGFPVAKRIDLPKKWRSFLAETRKQKRRL
jgi:hypothetical protein